MVLLATAAVIALVFFFLIFPQQEDNRRLKNSVRDANTKLQQIKTAIKQRATADETMAQTVRELNETEQDVANGDVYAWTYDTIRRFKSAYRVEISTPSQPTLGDVDVIANFPYKQVRVSLSGTAYYHDLGKFIADFENQFPHIRVLNLMIDPAEGAGITPEHLNFRMDIVALVKPNS